MKLTELEPHWIAQGPGRHGMGISFYCPHCQDTRIAVWFKVPLDGGPPASADIRTTEVRQGEFFTMPLWERTGDTFENITISPSIDASALGHWHGHVRNGEVV